jgi:hypothetical protein
LDELKRSPLVPGPLVAPDGWDVEWRRRLVDNLSILVRQLWDVGVDEIFIDGSFVEAKPHPNDIDGYFVCDVRELPTMMRRLNDLEPGEIWTWDDKRRVAHGTSTKRQLPMWHKYRVELYPHYGQLCGILSPSGHELKFPAAFRQARATGRLKGIVHLMH